MERNVEHATRQKTRSELLPIARPKRRRYPGQSRARARRRRPARDGRDEVERPPAFRRGLARHERGSRLSDERASRVTFPCSSGRGWRWPVGRSRSGEVWRLRGGGG